MADAAEAAGPGGVERTQQPRDELGRFASPAAVTAAAPTEPAATDGAGSGSVPGAPPVRFYGIAHPKGRQEDYNGPDFTESELRRLNLGGTPVRFEHCDNSVGRIESSWVDGDGNLRVVGRLDESGPAGELARHALLRPVTEGRGPFRELSIGTRILGDRRSGRVLDKEVVEVSIVREGKRPGCLIQTTTGGGASAGPTRAGGGGKSPTAAARPSGVVEANSAEQHYQRHLPGGLHTDSGVHERHRAAPTTVQSMQASQAPAAPVVAATIAPAVPPESSTPDQNGSMTATPAVTNNAASTAPSAAVPSAAETAAAAATPPNPDATAVHAAAAQQPQHCVPNGTQLLEAAMKAGALPPQDVDLFSRLQAKLAATEKALLDEQGKTASYYETQGRELRQKANEVRVNFEKELQRAGVSPGQFSHLIKALTDVGNNPNTLQGEIIAYSHLASAHKRTLEEEVETLRESNTQLSKKLKTVEDEHNELNGRYSKLKDFFYGSTTTVEPFVGEANFSAYTQRYQTNQPPAVPAQPAPVVQKLVPAEKPALAVASAPPGAPAAPAAAHNLAATNGAPAPPVSTNMFGKTAFSSKGPAAAPRPAIGMQNTFPAMWNEVFASTRQLTGTGMDRLDSRHYPNLVGRTYAEASDVAGQR